MKDDSHTLKTFTMRFKDKSAWNEFKDDLKQTLRENDIKFQYSEKTPTFYLLYTSEFIRIRVIWGNEDKDEALLFSLQAKENIKNDQLSACNEIYDLLQLFSGELIDGKSPYEW
ncbi:MAG: hypothetical protein ACFFAJ_05270 [Candidatus Hodarchaeota archaeon]